MSKEDCTQEHEDSERIGRTSEQNSIGSATSSVGSRSENSMSPLDDPNFAPPPPRPIESNHTLSQFMAEHEAEKKLPSYEKISHSGTCLSRISLLSLISRRWKPTFWIAYGDCSLLFFRSQTHFKDWLTNKYLTKKERSSLVKLHVDFITDLELDTVQGYQVSMIKAKWYKRGGMMHNFKLDKWFYDGGPTIAGAFASPTLSDINDLHTIMSEMAKRSPKNLRSMEIIAELVCYYQDEGLSVTSNPMFDSMFDYQYYSPRQAEAYLRIKSAASC